MSPAPQQRVEELAALSAAGAASAAERAELESLVAEYPGVRELMRGYADAASLVALDLVPLRPPQGALDGVKRRLAAGSGAPGGSSGGGPAGAPPVGRISGPGGDVIPLASRRRTPTVVLTVALPLVAAAALALVWWQEHGKAAELTAMVADLRKEVENERRVRIRAEEEAARQQRERDEMLATLQKVTTPALQLATAGDPRGVVLKMLIDPLTGSWYVMAFQVPAAEPDKDYQLWFVDKKNPAAPVPSVLFRAGPTGALQAMARVPAGIDPIGAAISLEKKGGSVTGKPDKVLGGGAFL